MIRFLQIITLTCLIQTSIASAKVIEKIVAIVNNQVITLSEVEQFKDKVKSGGLVDDALIKLKDTEEILKNDKSIVNHLIDEKILESEIKRKGLGVTIEKVEQEIRNITKRNGITRDQLKSALAAKGVKFSDYQDFIRTSLERQALIEKNISSKIQITKDDINSYFIQNSQKGDGTVFEYTIAHIMLLKNRGSRQEAKKRAEQVQAKIEEGMDFEKLANQFSEDPNFSQNGLLGTFKAGEMMKEFEEKVQTLEPGQVSGIVETDNAYHLVKVLKKKVVTDPRLEAEKGRIRSLLFAEAFKKQFRQWLDQKRDEAFIRIN